MLDFARDQIVPIGEVRLFLPRAASGKLRSTRSIYRWANTGLRGIILETVKIGGSTFVTHTALNTFFQKTAVPRPDPKEPAEIICRD